MSEPALALAMHDAAATLLRLVDDASRPAMSRAFDDAGRRWIEYRPRPRPGVSLAELDVPARKAAHRLLATALSPATYAQAMTVLALEEVLDRQEGWHRGRHSNDYRVVIFGEPGAERWGWRFEGHHLSVTMTIADGEVCPAPIFLGANPARVQHAGRTVLRPLAPEEDLARELLQVLRPADRQDAVVAAEAPADIRSGTDPQAPHRIDPVGVPASRLRPGDRQLLDELVGLYLDRLPATLAAQLRRDLDTEMLHFAWAGPVTAGSRHYYRIQAEDLLIEYDNTSEDGNHAHTVLRRPRSDFGADVLAEHRERHSH
ncbi:MAG TPA: DUF3500 domain-containing protein [Actinoplanes sp.]|nr:DUF3500 domain-containing protein [Actinoplanes sp.]